MPSSSVPGDSEIPGLTPISSLGYPDLPSIIHSCHPEPWTDEDQACFRIWFSLYL
jgi:hypothetical protein